MLWRGNLHFLLRLRTPTMDEKAIGKLLENL
jgi:hypothetical protein